MENVFLDYSRYYNLLYKNKDYRSESAFINGVIEDLFPGARTLLDVGCGTGRHAAEFHSMGYAVECVDCSENMLNIARGYLADRDVACYQGDIRNLNLDRTYDVIVSLFHVMSYQTENADLKNAFSSVSKHLKPGGIFLFDCWYGPCVLSQKPHTSDLVVEDAETRVHRHTEPALDSESSTVDVQFEISIENRKSGTVQTIRECHTMRYLFTSEISALMGDNKMKLVLSSKWLDTQILPDCGSWSAFYVGKKIHNNNML